MSKQSHGGERLFNDEHSRPARKLDVPSTFHYFPLLPKELRLRIWQCFLEDRQRIIRLYVSAGFETEGSLLDGLIRSVQPPGDGEPATNYTAIVEGRNLLCKLFHVNSEARFAALEFYRVPVPVVFGGGQADLWRHSHWVTSGPTSGDGGLGMVLLNDMDGDGLDAMATGPSGILHLNPEHDFLYIFHGWGSDSENSHVMVDFIQRFKTVHDPRGVGLLNLIADQRFLERFRPVLSNGEPSAFRDTMSQLREVFFACLRRVWRTFDGAAGHRVDLDPFVSQSYPMMALTPAFSRLPRDPRLIGPELSARVHLMIDCEPGLMARRWQEIMASLGLPVDTADGIAARTQFRYLVAADPRGFGNPPRDRLSALECLREEVHGNFPRLCRTRAMHGGLRPGFAERLEASRLAEQVDPVLGFWIFHPDAFPLPAQGRAEELEDLRAHWPELGVFELS